MKSLTQSQALQALTNAANSTDLPELKVYERYSQDKRKTVAKYFLQLGKNSISPVLDYENMNHFILGFSKAKKLLTDKK